MAWIYYGKLVETRFQADCLAARIESAEGWLFRRVPQYVGIFRTTKGRYGVKVLW